MATAHTYSLRTYTQKVHKRVEKKRTEWIEIKIRRNVKSQEKCNERSIERFSIVDTYSVVNEHGRKSGKQCEREIKTEQQKKRNGEENRTAEKRMSER